MSQSGATSGENAAALPSSSPPALDEQRVFRQLCWLSGLPIALSVVYAISIRAVGASAIGDLLATAGMAAIALGGALANGRLVRSALRLPSARDLLTTLGLALVLGPSLTLGFWLLRQLGFTLYSGYLTPYVQDGWSPWVGLADIAIATPLAEELLFRGLIQPKLGQILRSHEALIVQAALFSALHLSPVILVTHFAMGLAFGWIRRRSGSLLPSVLLHGAWNAWVVHSSSG